MELGEINEKYIREIADSHSILENGKRYFKSGRVRNFYIEDDRIFAKVIDSKLYNVEIYFEDEELETECDCPYQGYGCKHIVSVLYYWINNENEFKFMEDKKSLNSLKYKSIKDIINFNEITKESNPEKMLVVFGILKNNKINIRKNEKDKVFADLYHDKKRY